MSSVRGWSASLLAFALLCVTAATVSAQGAAISGQVTTEQGAALDLVNVHITEMNISVVTDDQGRYSITIPAERVRGQGVVLRVRRIGYTAQTRPIVISAGTQSHDFSLRADVNRLSEIVVTGVSAGTEKAKVPFAVTTLSADDLPAPSANALTQLQARVPGAQIVMPSGRPGVAPAIVIRGPKSLNANGRSQGPLIIVDGVILDGGTQDLNPLDIESIEIVKGAAGSSIYGSRAGSGVIQITTRSGRNAAPGVRFNVRNEMGFSNLQGRYPYSRNTMLMFDETGRNVCVTVSNQPACSRVVDFEAEALRINEQGGDFALQPLPFTQDYGISATPPRPHLKGLFQINKWPTYYDPVEAAATAGLYNTANVDMSGRFGNTGFFASVSHLSEEGSIAYLKGAQRMSGRVNLDHQIGEHWNLALNTYYARRLTFQDGQFFRLTRTPPSVNLLRRDAQGRLFIRSNPLNQGGQNFNPLYWHEAQEQESHSDRYLGSATARYTPLDWLEFQGQASIDRSRDNFWTLRDRGFRHTSQSSVNEGAMFTGAGSDLSFNLGAMGTARREIGNDLRTALNVRYTYEQQDSESISASGASIAVPGLRDLDNTTTSFNVGSGTSSIRAIGASVGGDLEYKDRYIFQTVYRYDGSSLFGENERWHPYYRASFAWRVAEEPFWPFVDAVNELKLRTSIGTAGGRPSFAAQYETVSVGAGGVITGANLGNRDLKPEVTTETEIGLDAEILGRFGVDLTYAHAITRDQIFLVPQSVSTGFANRWLNAGTLDGKTWELALNLPLITRRDVSWNSRISWDRTRTYITELGVPEFFQTSSSSTFKFAEGELLGTIYGKTFMTQCSQLPAAFRNQCGPGQEFQQNDEGWLVWVGAGNTPGQGITDNLWQSVRPGCIVGGVPNTSIIGEVACLDAGGVVNNPWGSPEVHWGMLMPIRDSTGAAQLLAVGNTLPDYRLAFSHTVQYKRLSAFALIDRSHGNKLMNQELHWSLGDFMVEEQDQGGKTVATAKPLGYYWRAARPENSNGVGGFYDVLGSNNHTVEDGSYTKIRELSLTYDVGSVPVVGFGDWSLTLTGRNLYTWTKFKGWDPEVGTSGGNLNSSALNAVAGFQYPPRRTFTFTVNTRF
ncbi:MAG TPA: SusC/RagA family TonB-linked outer membrane protein [Gemmatimonadaceae bacterium]|nr:SusC/RagA family TonB-linked outer membrane protein [Gemmatimonadaceae bacterium]